MNIPTHRAPPSSLPQKRTHLQQELGQRVHGPDRLDNHIRQLLLLPLLLLLLSLLEAEAVDGVGDGGLLPCVVVGQEVAACLVD